MKKLGRIVSIGIAVCSAIAALGCQGQGGSGSGSGTESVPDNWVGPVPFLQKAGGAEVLALNETLQASDLDKVIFRARDKKSDAKYERLEVEATCTQSQQSQSRELEVAGETPKSLVTSLKLKSGEPLLLSAIVPDELYINHIRAHKAGDAASAVTSCVIDMVTFNERSSRRNSKITITKLDLKAAQSVILGIGSGPVVAETAVPESDFDKLYISKNGQKIQLNDKSRVKFICDKIALPYQEITASTFKLADALRARVEGLSPFEDPRDEFPLQNCFVFARESSNKIYLTEKAPFKFLGPKLEVSFLGFAKMKLVQKVDTSDLWYVNVSNPYSFPISFRYVQSPRAAVRIFHILSDNRVAFSRDNSEIYLKSTQPAENLSKVEYLTLQPGQSTTISPHATFEIMDDKVEPIDNSSFDETQRAQVKRNCTESGLLGFVQMTDYQFTIEQSAEPTTGAAWDDRLMIRKYVVPETGEFNTCRGK